MSPKDVILMGKAQSGRECLFDADEVWGINNVAEHPEYEGKKFTQIFAFDTLPKEYTDGIKKFAPIISWRDYADIKYPLQEVLDTFKSRYFTNTCSYAIAYAALMKVERLRIYGIDVCFGGPYAQEMRGVDYWIGRAQERGVKIEVPQSSHLLRTVYGNMYGEDGDCNMQMYLHERINLINILPRQGKYSDVLKAQNAWWVLFPKEDEARAHGIQIQRDPAGNMAFGFGPVTDSTGKPVMVPTGRNIPGPDNTVLPEMGPKPGGEYTSDVQMPPETWTFMRDRLIQLEKDGLLPFSCITMYEKLILGKERA